MDGSRNENGANGTNASNGTDFEDKGSDKMNALETRLRKANEADAEAIAALCDELGYTARPEEIVERLGEVLEQLDYLVLVADAEGKLCGWLQAHSSWTVESGFRVEILGMVVASWARRRGVGRSLVGEAEKWGTALGAKTIVVRSNVNRVESHEFYRRVGYEVSKTQRVYRKMIG